MTDLFYSGRGEDAPTTPRELPASRHRDSLRPSGYVADKGLVDAVNVALLLGQPILLTGEAGTGKTQLASSVAYELGFGRPLRFDTKSTSAARDLFYTTDVVGRFHAAQTASDRTSALDFIKYNAFGEAILQSNELEGVRSLLPSNFQHSGPRRSVVLIDEIDKAPRDFPNDILAELEEMYFRIPELDGAVVTSAPEMRPVVIMTSNSEKNLPDAFLRRCIYYDIPFPDRDRLKEILSARLGQFASDRTPLVDTALDIFTSLRRDASGLRKKPATAELLAWLMALREDESPNPLEQLESALRSLCVVVKTKEDQAKARTIVEDWYRRQPE